MKLFLFIKSKVILNVYTVCSFKHDHFNIITLAVFRCCEEKHMDCCELEQQTHDNEIYSVVQVKKKNADVHKMHIFFLFCQPAVIAPPQRY